MNLKNIFGLHIGCEMMGGKLRTRLTGVSGHGFIVDEHTLTYKFKDCKLILRPLSSITEEHKREFEKEFVFDGYRLISFDYEDKDHIIFYTTKGIFTDRFGLHIVEAFWLASRGYDVGIVPNKYKIVERTVESKEGSI